MSEHDVASVAEAGEIADELENEDPFKTVWCNDEDGNPEGFLIHWRSDPEQWIYADKYSRENLDAMM
jgi:hypothetical protein